MLYVYLLYMCIYIGYTILPVTLAIYVYCCYPRIFYKPVCFASTGKRGGTPPNRSLRFRHMQSMQLCARDSIHC